jgi:hypothetical protein
MAKYSSRLFMPKLAYLIVRYVRHGGEKGFGQTREEIATFEDSKRAEDYLQSQMGKPEKDPHGGIIIYKLEDSPQSAISTPMFVNPVSEANTGSQIAGLTTKDAIENAIRDFGGRANLRQINNTVLRAKKFKSKTPLDSIRSDLYRGIEARRFVRNSDGTFSLGSKAGMTFQEFVVESVPQKNGVLIGGERLAPLKTKEHEMEVDFQRIYREIFGKGALYIPIKKLVGSKIKKVTDGVMLESDEKGQRFWIVEIELGAHDLETHVQAQVLGFFRALKDEKSIRILVNTIHEFIQSSDADLDWADDFFSEQALKMRPRPLQPYQYLDSLLHRKAGVIIVIDEVRPELKEIVDTISGIGAVKVVEFRTFKRNEEKVHTFAHVDAKQIS